METKAINMLADKLRLEALRMIYEGGDGHPGPALSCADIVAALYFRIMRVDPSDPAWEDRDRLILSKGHACPILYAALAEKGYYGGPVEHFHLRALGSTFQGHPVMDKTPGVDFTSGSLGNGLAIGAGMAAAAKYRGKDYYAYVIMGDGEMQEGVVWEGAALAAARQLDNLIIFVDKNGLQSGGAVEDIMLLNDPGGKLAAFGWDVQEIDGHDIEAICGGVEIAKSRSGKPHAIICNCVKGKGVPLMEHDNRWHKGVPAKEEYEAAVKTLGGKGA